MTGYCRRLKTFLTGATGFIGTRVALQLRARGDGVVAVARSRTRAVDLEHAGVDVVECSLVDRRRLAEAMDGCDAVVHLAGSYAIGISRDQRPAMYEANVLATEAVLDAALDVDVEVAYRARIDGQRLRQYGRRGRRRDLPAASRGLRQHYDETKHRAHLAAAARISTGAPIVIVQPGAVYGVGDHSAVGEQLALAASGQLPYTSFGDVGLSMCHVDDVADGVVRALDRGRLGESYVLAGENIRLGDAITRVARVVGRRPPRLSLPTRALRMFVPVAPLVGRRRDCRRTCAS